MLAERVKCPQNLSPPVYPLATLLVSHQLNARFGAKIAGADLIVLPSDPAARLPDAECARIEIAFFSTDVFPDYSRQFFSTVRKAPHLKWLHAFNVGVDHPIFTEMLGRRVRVTTSAGSTAEPIAQTAIMGMLALARGFPRWLVAQRSRQWNPDRKLLPPDLNTQTAIVIGLGRIGAEIARLARALGLKVIGIRRSPRRPSDPVDEMHPPAALPGLLPRCDWLVIACPLTAETRGLVDASSIAALPKGARVINIARGEIVDEPALIAALKSGHLAGAFLDVFATEPLPVDSPLWELPNVLATPHNSAVAAANDERVLEIFLANLERWNRGAPLENEATSKT